MLGVLAITLVAGCGVQEADQNAPGPAPTPATLREARAVPIPVYWLGPRYGDLPLTLVEASRGGATVGYGAPACDSGCTYPITVSSGLRRRDAFPKEGTRRALWRRFCFRTVQKALFMGCHGDGEYSLLSGRSDIALQMDARGINELHAVRRLRPLSRAAEEAPVFARPDPMACSVFADLARWFVVKVPQVLRPKCPE